MSSAKRIAVVILNWNGSAMMKKFLPSVIAHSQADSDVIVADNGSTDDSCEMLVAHFPEVRLIRLPENYGFAEGYNKALEQVDAEFFMLLNSDVEVSENWLRPQHDYMNANHETAADQHKILTYSQRDSFEYAGAAGGYIDRYGYPFCRGRIFSVVERDTGQYDSPTNVFWATGAALLTRKADWTAAGGLDGSFFAHQEEIDFCWRLRSRGRCVACVPQSTVWHVGGASLEQGNPRKTFLNFRNNLIMLYKNLPPAELKPVMRLRRWLDALAALQFLLSGSAANARAVWQGRKAFRKMRPELAAARELNLHAATATDIPERVPYSLLVAFYLKGRKTFSRLTSPTSPHHH